MNKKTIAIDIDDVIANSTEALRLVVNERYDVSLTAEHYKVDGDYWGYYERVWESHGLKDVDFSSLLTEMATDQSHVPLLPGASFAIGELSKKYHIAAVTARDSSWEKATLRWLNEHFGSTFSVVHFAGDKHDETAKTKGAVCKEVGAFVLVDDNIGHCRSALDNGLEALLFGDYGWHNAKTDGIQTCKDWPSVLEHFSGRI